MTQPLLIALVLSLTVLILGGIGRASSRRKKTPERETRGRDRYVYVIAATDARGRAIAPSKVGIAKDPEQRLRTFQTANPRPLTIYRTFRVARAHALEQAVHARLRPFRMKGEWFDVSPEQAVTAVHVVMERPRSGIGPAWQRLRLRAGLRRRGRALARRSPVVVGPRRRAGG